MLKFPLLAGCRRQIHAEKMATADPVCQRKKPGFPGLFLRIDEAYAACTGMAWRVSMMRLSAST
jgi:hypothetical protein